MVPDYQSRLAGGIAFRYVMVIGIAAFLDPTVALAYLDPGTGSIILQGLLASLAVAAATLGAYWQRAKAMLSLLFSRSERTRTDSDQDTED